MSESIPISLHLKVLTPQKLVVDEEVEEVLLPGLEGCLGVLPGHRNLVAALGEGKLTYKKSQKEISISVRGGYAEIFPRNVIVFTDLRKDEPDFSHEEKG